PGCLAIFFTVSTIQRLETSVVNRLLYIEPVFVALFGWLIFHEPLSFNQLIGTLILIASSLLLVVSKHKNKGQHRIKSSL
ncbi:MAG: DMT family transporter, partial [Oceanospirillaceae bacterium]|nr:DMT family transporter [Oceanospirillaceae bacterium]